MQTPVYGVQVRLRQQTGLGAGLAAASMTPHAQQRAQQALDTAVKTSAEHRLLSNCQRMRWLGAHGLNGSTRILEEALERCGTTVMTRN